MTFPNFDVESTMQYLTAESKYNRRYITPGCEINTGVYETKKVHVMDVRPRQEEHKLDVNGFQLFQHQSKVVDFGNKDEINRLYVPEIEEFVKHVTGADKVVAFRPTVRKAPSVKDNDDQPVAGDVHVDYTIRRSEQLGSLYLGDKPFPYRRLLVLSNWRALSNPPQDWPLAVCDARTVTDDEGLVNTAIYQDEKPDLENIPPIPEKGMTGEGYGFTYKSTHKWCYFSQMRRDELLVFKLNDSDHNFAWRTPHCSFFNPEEGSIPRESIEVRTCCYFK